MAEREPDKAGWMDDGIRLSYQYTTTPSTMEPWHNRFEDPQSESILAFMALRQSNKIILVLFVPRTILSCVEERDPAGLLAHPIPQDL